MAFGNVVEYLDGKELAVAYCLSGESKGKLSVVTPKGREETLVAKKILFTHGSGLAVGSSREDVLAFLRDLELSRTAKSQALDLQDLWELLVDEGERDWSLEELATFLFNENVGELERALAYRALLAERTYFWRKADCFRLRTREQVDVAKARTLSEAQRELERLALKSWLADVLAHGPSPPSQEHHQYIIEWKGRIRDAAIWGEKSSHYAHVQRLLKDFNLKERDPAFGFMVSLGEWTVDENLDLLANETPIEFSTEVKASAKSLNVKLQSLLDDPSRIDFSDWPCYSIDDLTTTEIDDAIAYRPTDQGCELAVHIADASAFLTPDLDVLEQEMKARATSIYLPDQKIRMIPAVLSDGVLSLVRGTPRAALTFLASFDDEGRLLSSRIVPSKIVVAERLDYDGVDEKISLEDPYWLALSNLAEQLKGFREKKGALNIPFPRMEVKLEGEKVVLEPESRDSLAQTIVSEAMITANRIAADYMATHGLPAIFRGQAPPDPPVEKRATWLPHHLYEVRRSLPRSHQGLDPLVHSGLGLDRYIQVTSPIRRYRDLLHQRQLHHHIRYGQALYSREALEELMTVTSGPITAAEKMERHRRTYYLLKYLAAQKGQELGAIVLAASTERYTLLLDESLREVDVPQGSGNLRNPGEAVKVKLLSVYPREGVVRVSSPLT